MAHTGDIGGSESHEFHLASPVGEDDLLVCSGCGFAINAELNPEGDGDHSCMRKL